MNVTGVIGFIVLIILLNVLNRVLQALTGRARNRPPARGGAGRSGEPRGAGRDEGPIVLGRRAAGGMGTMEPDDRFRREPSFGDEPAASKPEAQRSVESWLEEILGDTSHGESPRSGHTPEDDETESASEDMRRYGDFEQGTGEASREERFVRPLPYAADRPGAEPRAAVERPAVSNAARPLDSALRLFASPANVRDSILAAEILGPCRSRAGWRRFRPRSG